MRVNEAYVDVAKGPFFMRIGKQAISWGEADTIGLLDANNPFDVLILPGLQMDLDEARIPLWTLRTTYELFSILGALLERLLRGLLVPGLVDTESAPEHPGREPVLPASADPGARHPGLRPAPGLRAGELALGSQVPVRHQPRLQLLGLDLSYISARPAPTIVGLSAQPDSYVTTVLNHGLTTSGARAVSCYSDILTRSYVRRSSSSRVSLVPRIQGNRGAGRFRLPGARDLRRCERPPRRVRPRLQLLHAPLQSLVELPRRHVDRLRGEPRRVRQQGLPLADHQAVGDRAGARGRVPAGSNAPPSCDNKNDPGPDGPGLSRCDFVNLDPIEAFAQVTLRSDFMHGRLTPQLTTIGNFRGRYVRALGRLPLHRQRSLRCQVHQYAHLRIGRQRLYAGHRHSS